MRNSKTRRTLKLTVILIGVVLVSLTVMVTPAYAITAQDSCEVILGGIWLGSTPDEVGGICLNTHGGIVNGLCPAGWYADMEHLGGLGWVVDCHEFPTPWGPPVADTGAPINYGMRRKGLCKLMDIDDAYLGGTITAIIKGRPSVLKLKADGKTYSLPVVPGSVVANGDGTYTAQFYTMDPETGQALVPAGDYSVRCHGWGGSNDGGSSNTVSIGY